MYRLSHTLLAWLVLVQSIALSADNADLTFAWVRNPSLPLAKALVAEGIIFEPWTPVATFGRHETCLADIAQREHGGTTQVWPLEDGTTRIVLTYRYRCVEQE
jgi:hypothetical protein